MPDYHPACQGIVDDIARLQAEAALLAEDLKVAAPNQKPAIATQIKKINRQIAAQQKVLGSCVREHPLPPAVVATLREGSIGLWARPGTGPGVFSPITLGVTFHGWDYARASMTFPTNIIRGLKFNYLTFTHTVEATLSMTSSGDGGYDLVTHHISIPSAFRIEVTGISGLFSFLLSSDPSTLTLFPPGLTTHTLPSRLDPNTQVIGHPPAARAVQAPVVLASEGRVSDGLLDGRGIAMVIRGILGPLPPTP
jgi:hypothetical protein